MVNTLKFNISVPTAYVFVKRFLKAAQADRKVSTHSLIIFIIASNVTHSY
jgi:cyclin B